MWGFHTVVTPSANDPQIIEFSVAPVERRGR